MGKIRIQPSGKLYFDFRYLGKRCREVTALPNSPTNFKRLEMAMKKIDAEILSGHFDYASYFPTSSFLKTIVVEQKRLNQGRAGSELPTFEQMANTWLNEHEVEWRETYRVVVLRLFARHIIPGMGVLPIDAITRDDLVAFRNSRVHYRTPGGLALQSSTINRMMTLVKAVLEEASASYKIPSPYERIKKLKEEKRHVSPFTLEEVSFILADVREDFRDYLLIKFFTGMRTGEVHGLRWKCIDFDRGLILVRETYGKSGFEYTKNDYSQRDILMTARVREALLRQHKLNGHYGRDGLVFCNSKGLPIDDKNFCNRIWKPMLEDIDIPYRRPYDTRHTAATLMLAAGESPEWIAKQLGHSSTKMLFSVYSSFVPNLTRNDGSAMDRLITQSVSNF